MIMILDMNIVLFDTFASILFIHCVCVLYYEPYYYIYIYSLLTTKVLENNTTNGHDSLVTR